MRDADNMRDVAALGIDWMGMIFWQRSPRYVSTIPTDPSVVSDRAGISDATTIKTVKRVGVFVDDTPQNIITHVVNYKLDLIQLHGNETPTLIRNLRATIDPDIRPGIKFIKAISVTSAKDIERCKAYEDCADYFLFDTHCTTVGGSGKQFDWSVLDNYDGTRPFLLSGGIGPDDADRIKAISHKKLIGIDLNSRFETAPGMKDVTALKDFLNHIFIQSVT